MTNIPESLIHKKGLIFLYGLYEPEEEKPFYVGVGDEARPNTHWKTFLYTGKHFNDEVVEVFKGLKKAGQEPIAKILAIYDCEESADIVEVNAIKAYGRRKDGGCLCNIMPGGSSGARKAQRRKETNILRSASLKKFNSENPEVRKQAGLKNRGCTYSDVTLERM